MCDHLHACCELGVGWEEVAGNLLGFADARAVSLFGRHGCFDRRAFGHALELLLEAGNDVAGAVQVEQRAPVAGLVDDFTISAGTLVETARVLVDRGARAVYAAVSHGVFAEGSMEKLDRSALHAAGEALVPIADPRLLDRLASILRRSTPERREAFIEDQLSAQKEDDSCRGTCGDDTPNAGGRAEDCDSG